MSHGAAKPLGPWGCGKCGQNGNFWWRSQCRSCKANAPKKYFDAQKRAKDSKRIPKTFLPRQASGDWSEGPPQGNAAKLRKEVDNLKAQLKQLQPPAKVSVPEDNKRKV